MWKRISDFPLISYENPNEEVGKGTVVVEK
jgi:hypothetical protein